MKKDPPIKVGDLTLNAAHVSTLFTAVQGLIAEYVDSPDALGEDDHGRSMVQLYLARAREINALWFAEGERLEALESDEPVKPSEVCKARDLLRYEDACFRKPRGQMVYKIIRHDSLPYISGDKDNKVYGVNIDHGGICVIDADKDVVPVFLCHTATIMKGGQVFCPTCGAYRFSADRGPIDLLRQVSEILTDLIGPEALNKVYVPPEEIPPSIRLLNEVDQLLQEHGS